jgi:hypothetical protein
VTPTNADRLLRAYRIGDRVRARLAITYITLGGRTVAEGTLGTIMGGQRLATRVEGLTPEPRVHALLTIRWDGDANVPNCLTAADNVEPAGAAVDDGQGGAS